MYGPRKRVGSSVDHTWVCSELDAGGSGDDVGVRGIPKRGSCLWQQWPFVVDRQAVWFMDIFPLEAGQTQGHRDLSWEVSRSQGPDNSFCFLGFCNFFLLLALV